MDRFISLPPSPYQLHLTILLFHNLIIIPEGFNPRAAEYQSRDFSQNLLSNERSTFNYCPRPFIINTINNLLNILIYLSILKKNLVFSQKGLVPWAAVNQSNRTEPAARLVVLFVQIPRKRNGSRSSPVPTE